MKKFLGPCAWLALGATLASVHAAPAPSKWERSIVTLEVTSKQYDYQQPWAKRQGNIQKNAVVVGARELLTTADGLADHTLIRAQAGGRGKWSNASLRWLDYHANLALLTSDDDALWKELRPAALASSPPLKGEVQILRWREGNLESRKGEISRYIVRKGQITPLDHLILEVDSDIRGGGWSEPLVANDKLIGLATGQSGNSLVALPVSFIRHSLTGARTGAYRGLGVFDFFWQTAENPATLAFLKLTGEPRGVVIVKENPRPDRAPVFQPRDILLQIGEFKIDLQGNYSDPDLGNLLLENLSTRGRWAGDAVPMKIWRDGKELEVKYTLPRIEYSNFICPDYVFDQEPEYLMAGGLLFQPLTGPYLRSFGADGRRLPMSLRAFDQKPATTNQPAVVVLAGILPDPFNEGYQDYRGLPVSKVNGKDVFRLADLAAALEQPLDGFHVIELKRNDAVNKIILAADGTREVTSRILKLYNLPADRVIQASGK